ncbi:MAG TPA: PRC-barrel domain-containing protein [Longimicrobiales bacterium]|nr:PRC-barrel domain-containing protein [Longimicrobiales bacterium]
MARNDRLRRDHAGIGPEPHRGGLQPLKKTKGFRIAKGEPDIRGWEVHTLNGRRVGDVDDLLVDVDAGDVVMMDVEMRGSQRHLELPIRSAQLDRERKRVIVDSGDVERYGGRTEDLDGDGIDDRDERLRAPGARDLDRDGVDDRDQLARERTLRDLDRDGIDDRDELRTRKGDVLRSDDERLTRAGTRLERDELPADVRADTDEVVVERRPVVEEVVVRRRVVDADE